MAQLLDRCVRLSSRGYELEGSDAHTHLRIHPEQRRKKDYVSA